jgi:hypothetical protein
MSAEPKVAPIVLIGGVLHLKADKQVHLKASKDSDAKVAQPTKKRMVSSTKTISLAQLQSITDSSEFIKSKIIYNVSILFLTLLYRHESTAEQLSMPNGRCEQLVQCHQ